ncbi:MAG: aminotransferase class IV [Acidobacteriota bacterium]
MGAIVNVNGHIADQAHATISVFDHGFLYGEGVYETMRTYHHQPFLFDRHMRRLRNSARMISLPLPFTEAEMADQIAATMAAAQLGGEAYIRVLVTRGVGDLTYDLDATPTPSVVIIIKAQIDPPPDTYQRGVRVVIVDVVRNHPGSVDPQIKSNNLMNTALAMQEAFRSGAFEGVMRNYRGEIAECTTSNLFVVRNGTALTPPLDAGLLAGITREFVFDIGAETGIPVAEATLRDDDLFGADEAFLTSTTREIVPIVTVGDRPIGNATPGAVTLALLQAFRRKAQEMAESQTLELKK